MSEVIVYSPNPADVAYRLQQANWRYINTANRNDDWAYSKISAIPILFQYVATRKEIPTLDECCHHLWQYHNSEPIDKAITTATKAAMTNMAKDRTRKLVMDFFRELHTFGLLSHHQLFGSVRYAKGEDIYLNVDFTAMPSLVLASVVVNRHPIGIQSAMRNKWSDEQFTMLKERRKTKRDCDHGTWDGPIYWLTNKDNPNVLRAGGCWLFTPKHIDDLVEQMKPSGESRVAINSEIV